MATITKISAFVGKAVSAVDLASSGNTLQVYNLEIVSGGDFSFVGGAQVLTSAKLDSLLGGAASDAGAYHNHDGQYFTETELTAGTEGSSGATLINVDTKAYANITGLNSVAARKIQAVIDAINTTLGTISGSSHDAVTLAAGATQEVLSLSNQVITANAATITTDGYMSAEDKVKLDGIEALAEVNNISDTNAGLLTGAANTTLHFHSSDRDRANHSGTQLASTVSDFTSAAQSAVVTQAITNGVTATAPSEDAVFDALALKLNLSGGTMSGAIAMGNSKITGLAAGTANGDAVRYEQWLELQSIIQNFEFQDSALDYIADNTIAPLTEVTGDRYVLSHDGGTPHANYDGAAAGNIVEFNGTLWVALAPSTGMIISVDDESNSLRQWGGSSWSQKYFEATTASTGLEKVGFDIRLASSSAGNGLGFDTGVLSVNVDDSTVELNADTLRVKDLGISTAKLAADSVTKIKLNADVAGNGLVQQTGGELEVNGTYVSLTNNSGVSVAAGSVVRIIAGGFSIADADLYSTAKGTFGVLLATTANLAVGKIQVAGVATVNVATNVNVDNGALASFGEPVYLSKSLAGAVTQFDTSVEASVTGDAIIKVGIAISATSILLQIGDALEVV